MIGFPKYFNCRRDYYNIIRADIDRGKMAGALQQLLNTATRQEAIWPEGYDPANRDPNVPPVTPVGWETVDNPGGTIFLLGFTLARVRDLMTLILELQPLQDQIIAMADLAKVSDFAGAEFIREGLSLTYAWLPAEITAALQDYGIFETAVIADDYQTAQGIIVDVQLRLAQKMETLLTE